MMIALYIIGGIVLFIILLVFLVPTDFRMERDVLINKPKEVVFPYLKSLKNQDDWSVWNMRDPNMKKDFKGTDGTIGAIASWDSQDKNVGKGEQEIKKIVEGERVELELRFAKPMNATHDAWLIAKAAGNNQTTVTWGFSGKSVRPMNVMMLLMKGKLMKDFDAGLANLKRILESK